ncbi:MAG TPA: DUF2249 domain-containing protein [Verrucomicrobiae bacterium]|nr:DUF2249 domain-containing protein [Verrucomicrobiae bacterium]
MSSETVTLDVREDIAQGREPFGRIMSTVAQLRAGEKLRLIAPFEPLPLYSVLAKKGYAHTSRQLESGDWEVLFTPGVEPKTAAQRSAPSAGGADSEKTQSVSFIELDARGLEPPQPMVKILEALATLPAGTGIRARTDRRPMHLYAHLEERGFVSETTEQPDGSFLTHIRPR